jgi:hypothetical protein
MLRVTGCATLPHHTGNFRFWYALPLIAVASGNSALEAHHADHAIAATLNPPLIPPRLRPNIAP